jgi:hypothetical protein
MYMLNDLKSLDFKRMAPEYTNTNSFQSTFRIAISNPSSIDCTCQSHLHTSG